MELFATRREIRRRLQARLGNTTDDSQAPQVLEQFNEWIRAAAETVYLRCPWQQGMRETLVSIGINQRFINYPTNAGPGNIQSIGVWDEDAKAYRRLRRGTIPVELDDEPLQDDLGDEAASRRTRPDRYELKTQIEPWPRSDKAYELKIDHTVHPDFGDDITPSVVDAEAIILWSMADAYDFQGDNGLANTMRSRFEERIRALVSAQHPLPVWQRGRGGRRTLGRCDPDDYQPNSGSWPSVMP